VGPGKDICLPRDGLRCMQYEYATSIENSLPPRAPQFTIIAPPPMSVKIAVSTMPSAARGTVSSPFQSLC
jgi:hypothetical protein